ncbi:MAG TPA: hypothetical protein VMA55_21655 [Acidovorax sp.]|nr:hypothetical protein [Acidovorax sp.]
MAAVNIWRRTVDNGNAGHPPPHEVYRLCTSSSKARIEPSRLQRILY